ncbi:MAG TPA: hypothetical protein VHD56_19110 [Tepidisphaeraceae bacterium]|nr:hypothetical protein [Tepidisphaeraceae bacterium]
MKSPRLRKILGQPSWEFKSDCVSACLTETGGHLGPVRFRLGNRVVEPFSVAPWAEESIDAVPMLQALRGDFFCFPFGGNDASWKGENHPPHGEGANRKWKVKMILQSKGNVLVQAIMSTKARPGRIVKTIILQAGRTVIYQEHQLSGYSGEMPVGHHPMLLFPDEPGSGLLSFSKFVHGQVYPGQFEKPESRGYQSLRRGATFRSLGRVPLLAGGLTDLSRYPARRGYEDLVLLCSDPSLPFAWSAVAFPKQRYAWFALRDPRVLRNTILWISNGGRHYAPWSGRHINVMGIEDTTSYFHEGIAPSIKPNSLNRRRIPTTISLDPSKPTKIAHIMGVAPIPAGFDHVADIQQTSTGIVMRSRSGKRVACKLDLSWLGSLA